MTDVAMVTIARFVCTKCEAELMRIEQRADTPGVVTVPIPRSMTLTCRVCMQRFQDEQATKFALHRLRTWPGSNSVN